MTNGVLSDPAWTTTSSGHRLTRRVAERKMMISGVRLASPNVSISPNKYELLISVKADRTDEVYRLTLSHVIPEFVDHLPQFCLKQFVSCQLPFVVIVAPQLPDDSSKSLAELDVGHVRRRKLRRKIADEPSSFGIIGRFPRRKKTFDCLGGLRSFTRHTQRGACKAHQPLNLTEIHFSIPPIQSFFGSYRTSPAVRKLSGGCSQTFERSLGTGVGRHAHDLHQNSENRT